MNNLIVLYLNDAEVWLRISAVHTNGTILDAVVVDDDAAPVPGWLLRMLNDELYEDVMDQLYGEEIPVELM